MKMAIIVTAAVLSAVSSVSVGRETDAADLRRLAEENKLLKAQLADSRKRIEQIEKQLADLVAAVRQLEKAVARCAEAKAGAGSPSSNKAAAGGSKGFPATAKLVIRVEPGGWGGASARDIQKVLLSAGGELWRWFPGRRLKPIIVRHSSSGPITLYRRGAGGEYIVKLDVEGRHWAQFAYQFAHEFCHVLSNYDKKTSREHKWFAESLCEMASAFAIRRMAAAWKKSPPYPNWKTYAPALQKYADDLLRKGPRLPAGTTLAQWYRDNEAALRKEPCDRRKNKVVAYELLGLFEASPAGWEAVGCLNMADAEASGGSFAGHLAAWRKRCPERHKKLVGRIMELFGMKDPAGEPGR